MQMATFGAYDRQPYMERVRQFLAREEIELPVPAPAGNPQSPRRGSPRPGSGQAPE